MPQSAAFMGARNVHYSIKARRAAKIERNLSSHPLTWMTLLKLIPSDVWDSLNSVQIAKLCVVLYRQYNDGHTAGLREAGLEMGPAGAGLKDLKPIRAHTT